jgi:hypothetical protein
MLLGIAAVVGLLSIGAVLFALKGHGSSATVPPANLSTGPAVAPGPVDLTAGMDAGAPAAVPAVPEQPLQGLDDGKGSAAHGGSSGAKHAPGHDAGGGHVQPGPAPSHGPAPITPPPITPPAAGEPLECVKARIMRAAGNIAAFQTLEKQCVAKGGHI